MPERMQKINSNAVITPVCPGIEGCPVIEAIRTINLFKSQGTPPMEIAQNICRRRGLKEDVIASTSVNDGEYTALFPKRVESYRENCMALSQDGQPCGFVDLETTI